MTNQSSIYHQFGVSPIINACGSVTRLGGAPMPSAVLKAFTQAAAESVPLEQMQAAASRKIAELTGMDSGIVTSGAAASLTLGAAAILAGHDLRRIESLPHSDDFPNQFIIAREQRSGYDHSVRAAGARLVEVGFNEIVSNAGVRRTEPWEYEAAINSNTAGVVYVLADDSAPALEAVVEVARRHNLPVLVDASAEVPPRGNLKAIGSRGADLVAFSGGKGIRGPQSTGILCGRRDLISSAALQMLDMDDHFELWEPPPELIDRSLLKGMPRHGIGRALKVSKEEIVALLTALELFQADGYRANIVHGRELLETIAEKLSGCSLTTRFVEPLAADRLLTLEIQLGPECRLSAMEICRQLRRCDPSIYVGHGKLSAGILVVNPMCLDAESAAIVAKEVRRLSESG